MTLRRGLRGIAVFFLFCAAFFLVGEAIVRFSHPLFVKQSPAYYYRQYREALTQPDKALLWSGKVGANAVVENSEGRDVAYALNSFGWRDKEFSPERKYRVLVLGDSFSFGMGVEERETFASLLERAHPDTEFWNASVLGYAPDQTLLQIRERLPDSRWDAWILQLSNNDLSEIAQHRWLGPTGGEVPAGKAPVALEERQPRRLFQSSSEFLNLLRYFSVLLSGSTYPDSERMSEALDRILFSVHLTLEAAKESDIPVVILEASDWGENAYGSEWGDAYRKAIKELAEVHKVPVLDPFEKYAPEDFLPFPDLHWKLRAHAKVAMDFTNLFRAKKFPFARSR